MLPATASRLVYPRFSRPPALAREVPGFGQMKGDLESRAGLLAPSEAQIALRKVSEPAKAGE
jgi:hypothetical protein